ncbi:MAG: hypothetical protein GSR86_00790 [Desulfurococcales archaeon]|nr:hypothetical protein [Desulfurococcales archaeon]
MVEKVVLKIELDRELYRRLEERARSLGYPLVVDYVRELIARDASSPGGGVDEKRLADLVSRRVERVVADIVNPFTGKIDELARRVADLVERLEKGEGEEVQRVEQEPRQRMGAIERLRQQKVVFWDDVSWMRAPDRFFGKLEREGAVVFDIDGEKVAVDRGFWSEFVKVVEEIGVRDLEEAALLVESSLGGKAGELFRKLVRSGMAYYDEDLGRWMIPQP